MQQDKLSRLQTLQSLQFEITTARLAAWVGREVEVLIDGPSTLDPNKLQGRTSQNITFNISGQEVGQSTAGVPAVTLKAGQIINCRVEGCSKFTLKGLALTSLPK